MNVTSAGNPSQINTKGAGPEYVGVKPFKNPHRGVTATHPYWNPAAFDCAYTATVASCCANPGYPNQAWQQGNWARTRRYTPGLENFDANLGRTFHIWESHTFLVRVEAFSAVNHVNWTAPATTVPSSANFGVITSTTEPIREL